ncbi:MAG: HAD family hydrolase [Pseudomarimonas sp.]
MTPSVRSQVGVIELVGFDADDTLWHSEGYFQDAHAEFEQIVGGYVDLADVGLHQQLLATEQRNIGLFGYGAKGMTLSMIETAIALTDARISAADIHRLVDLGKSILTHPVELLEGIPEAVAAVAARWPIVLITKGDLFHQEAKVRQCGLADVFQRIEIVSEKDSATYARVQRECGVAPTRFAMVGNSLRSDIAPVLNAGGFGVHLPYRVTWSHELQAHVAADHPRLRTIGQASEIPAALAELAEVATPG